MSLSGIVGVFVLPPGCFLALASAGAALAASRRAPRLARAALALGLAGLWVAGMPTVGLALRAGLEHGLAAETMAAAVALRGPDPPGAIVLLSGDQAENLSAPRGVAPGAFTLERERAAAALARRTGLPILASGGRIHPWAPPLGEIMADSLWEDFGLRARWVEAASADTWENARFSANTLRPAGIGTVYVVTHAWHMRRALLAFRRAGLRALPAPVGLDAPPSTRNLALLPTPQGWLTTYYATHEWVGWAWYALRR